MYRVVHPWWPRDFLRLEKFPEGEGQRKYLCTTQYILTQGTVWPFFCHQSIPWDVSGNAFLIGIDSVQINISLVMMREWSTLNWTTMGVGFLPQGHRRSQRSVAIVQSCFPQSIIASYVCICMIKWIPRCIWRWGNDGELVQRGRREGDGVSSRLCADFHNPRSCLDDNVEHIGAGEQWYR